MTGVSEGVLSKWFGADLEVMLQQLGSEIDSVAELTRIVSPGQRKAAFRIDLRDGPVVKARRFKTAQRWREAMALTPLLQGIFLTPGIIAAHGCASLEEWVDGVPLHASDVTGEQAQRVGAMLGRLHALVELPFDLPCETPDVDWYSGRISAHLDVLVAAGGLPASIASILHVLAEEARPVGFESGLIHGDFCADNIVVTSGGELYVIDNESLRLGALDYDLARCWSLWPMSDAVRQAFSDGYESYRSLTSFRTCADFWIVRALCRAAYSRIKHNQSCAGPVAALIKVASGETPWESP